MTGGECVALTQLRPNPLTNRRDRWYESTLNKCQTLSRRKEPSPHYTAIHYNVYSHKRNKEFWGILSDTIIVFVIYCNGKFYKISITNFRLK